LRKRLGELYKHIGKKIKEIRLESSMSQDELANKAELKRPSIVLIEQGAQKLPIDRLYLIADALKVPIYSLLPNKINRGNMKSSFDEISKIRTNSEEEKAIENIIKKVKQKNDK